MQIVCGNDITEVERIKNAIENLGEKFLNEIYTEKEIEYCESKKVQKYQSYAARFAAKEAAFKAFNKYLGIKNCNWKVFEVANDIDGKPRLFIHLENCNIENTDISISHCKEYAVVSVVGIINN